MIKGICHTNVDEGRNKEWPTVFAKVPEKGDRVRSNSGYELVVCGITHSMRITKEKVVDVFGNYETTLEPFILVELTQKLWT